ncbi:MFS transporter [Janthinobacterium sp.]|uniref:MFS transporter n=1 Tax=Janthinobacterium sp. TaxID=1871054 RepID=UPI0026345B09|nr:MFS transporter [Janthinobacterium sp.]
MQLTGTLQQRATRLVFFAAGFGMAAWAPLVPYAKSRLGMDEATLGFLLLCLGGGSLCAMPFTGVLAARFGCRKVILAAGVLFIAILPGLALANTPIELGLVLLLFGAAMGTFDVAMNIQAVFIEKANGGSMMSGFHALFSVGGFAGAGFMALLLWLGLTPALSCVVMMVLLCAILAAAQAHLLPTVSTPGEKTPLFVLPHGAVILIGLMCFIVFLAEGAILDWSALFLTTTRGMAEAQGGLGYAAFAIAMTLGRFTGDKVVRRFGGKRVLTLGGLCAASGFFLAVIAPVANVALVGFVLIGLGAANIVPILFTAAGSQKAMPPSLAVAAITTIGYAGILAGPAVIGFVAHATSLNISFTILGAALLLVAASSRLVTASKQAA